MNPNFNRIGNSQNPYQGKDKRVLCICSAGLLRSPTAAYVLQNKFGYNTRACGANSEFALIPVDEVLVHWADELVFMEQAHYDSVSSMYSLTNKNVAILNIPDRYERMNKELQDIILKQYDDYLKIKDNLK